jgi:hypothetical protein
MMDWPALSVEAAGRLLVILARVTDGRQKKAPAQRKPSGGQDREIGQAG